MTTERDREDIQRMTAWEEAVEARWEAVDEAFARLVGAPDRDAQHLQEARYDLDLLISLLNRELGRLRRGEYLGLPQPRRTALHEVLWRLWALSYDAAERIRRVQEDVTPEDQAPLDFEADQQRRRQHREFWLQNGFSPPT